MPGLNIFNPKILKPEILRVFDSRATAQKCLDTDFVKFSPNRINVYAFRRQGFLSNFELLSQISGFYEYYNYELKWPKHLVYSKDYIIIPGIYYR